MLYYELVLLVDPNVPAPSSFSVTIQNELVKSEVENENTLAGANLAKKKIARYPHWTSASDELGNCYWC